jgi:hypothetical protein
MLKQKLFYVDFNNIIHYTFSMAPSVINGKLLNMLLKGTAHFKNVNNGLNTSIYSYFETSGGQSYYLFLNVVHFLNTSLD